MKVTNLVNNFKMLLGQMNVSPSLSQCRAEPDLVLLFAAVCGGMGILLQAACLVQASASCLLFLISSL